MRLAWISEGKKALHTCFVCRRELDNDTMVCRSCQEKYNRIQTVEKKQPAPSIKGGLDYTGAVMVGLIEELGKILVAAVFIKQLNAKYLLNGMLIGAAVGSGFAVFETAGYAFRFGVSAFIIIPRIDVLLDEMVDILFLRGWSSIGSHVAWSAIAGAGLLLAKGSGPFETGNLTSPKFLTETS